MTIFYRLKISLELDEFIAFVIIHLTIYSTERQRISVNTQCGMITGEACYTLFSQLSPLTSELVIDVLMRSWLVVNDHYRGWNYTRDSPAASWQRDIKRLLLDAESAEVSLRPWIFIRRCFIKRSASFASHINGLYTTARFVLSRSLFSCFIFLCFKKQKALPNKRHTVCKCVPVLFSCHTHKRKDKNKK